MIITYKQIRFYGLFFLTEETQNLNFNTNKIDQQREIYLKCAANLSRSLYALGYKFILLCNNYESIKKILIRNKIELNIEEINFETYVPKNIHFSSCHYRVDVFKYLSEKSGQLSILIDLDVIVVDKLPDLREILLDNVGYVNNISDNIIPAYGMKFIDSQLKIIKSKYFKRWVGGDFFAGNENFYKLLHEYSKKFQSSHVQNRIQLKTMTDELFLTATINKIDNDKLFRIEDINNLKLFSRFWSVNVKHEQKKFNYIINNYPLLHLPTDKKKLSYFYDKKLNIEDSKVAYINYINSFKHIIYNLLSKFLPTIFKKFIKKLLNN